MTVSDTARPESRACRWSAAYSCDAWLTRAIPGRGAPDRSLGAVAGRCSSVRPGETRSCAANSSTLPKRFHSLPNNGVGRSARRYKPLPIRSMTPLSLSRRSSRAPIPASAARVGLKVVTGRALTLSINDLPLPCIKMSTHSFACRHFSAPEDSRTQRQDNCASRLYVPSGVRLGGPDLDR
jgi:hypothetical protein